MSIYFDSRQQGWRVNNERHLISRMPSGLEITRIYSCREECGSNFKSIFSEHMLQIKFVSISCEIALGWMLQYPIDIVSSNGLVHTTPTDNKLLPEPMLTQMVVGKWWSHQREIFSTLLALCVGNSPVTCEFPSQRPVTQGFDVFYDLRLEQTVEQTIVRLVIWVAIVLIMTSL